MVYSYRRSIWRLRWDLLLTVLVSFALASGAQWLANRQAPDRYADYQAEHAAEAGTVGAPAAEDLPRAATLADMEEHALFTMEMGSVAFISNSPGGYIDGLFWNIFTLEDGTRIAAKVNGNAVVYREDPENSLNQLAVLPVGTLVHEDLTPAQLEVLDQYRGVTVTDRYIDMEGGHAVINEADFTEGLGLGVFFAVFVPACIVLHVAGVKIGFFPPLLPRRKKAEDTEP